jgi:hypothetical protein
LSRLARVVLPAIAIQLLLHVPAVGWGAARPEADEAWLSRARRHITLREYRASENDAGLQAPNRRHAIRTYFEPTGIRVVDRIAGGIPELLALRLVRLGRPQTLTPVGPGVVRSDGPRVEIQREALVEWYVNDPAGLEQGFTLAKRPEGEGPVVFDLSLEGAVALQSGEALRIRTSTGRVLDYAKLTAFDAAGMPLRVMLSAPTPQQIQLRVDDADAAYPIVVDPLLTAAADTLLESNQASATLGWSVAGAGDVDGDGFGDVIVGADFYDAGQADEGAAFVFLGSAIGVADASPVSAHAQLEADQAGARMGYAVATAGDVNGDGFSDVVVGADLYDAGQSDEGAAFVFLGSASGIADASPASAHAQLESDQADARLGRSVAGAGDVDGDGFADIIVGADLYDDGEADEGSAFVFLGSAAGIVDATPAGAHAQLQADQANARMGTSVAGAGDVNGDGFADVIVGARLYDAGQNNEGAAFVFLGSASGIGDGSPASADTQLEANQADAHLGISVAAAGDVDGDAFSDVIVGADLYDAGQNDEGAAFVFLGSASGIPDAGPASAHGQLEPDQADANLGFSVGGAGDVDGDGFADVIVGAWRYDAGENDEGAAFVFLGSASGTGDGNPASAHAQLESDQADANLGISVGGAGDVDGDGFADVIVGAYNYDAGEVDEGAAFVFLGGSAGIADGTPASAHAQLEGDQTTARLGFSVAGAGDVDGDGFADVIVGAWRYDAGQSDEGAAFVFLGSAEGIADATPATAHAQLESDQVGANMGESVAGAGDVNGDGFADVIVGAHLYDAGETDEGAAFVFLGSANGIASATPATAHAQLEGDQASAEMAVSVAGAGDVNGDGFGDVIVGAWHYDAGQTDEGAAFVFLGSAAGITGSGPANADARLESDQGGAPGGQLGISVAGAGDVDGDGYGDVVVGAHTYDAGQTDEGAAFVFLGSATGIADGTPANAHARLESDQADAWMGVNVGGAGDVDADGFSDLIIGARLYDAGETDEGAAFVFLGSASGIADASPATAHAQLEGDQASAWMGYSVDGAGDVDGDGYSDVIVGAGRYDAGETDEGAAFVFLGSASGIADASPATAHAGFEADQATAFMGTAVSGAGDVNGDGFSDVIVGAYRYDSGQTDEGAVFVFLGNTRPGRGVAAQQSRGDLSAVPVQPWGGAGTTDAFAASLTATHPEGRGRVKLEVDYCPPGVPFGDVSCGSHSSATWTEVTPPSAQVRLTEQITGLTTDTLYRWRARVLYAHSSVTQPGISAPQSPRHGPWRRLAAQWGQGDVRTVPEPGGALMLLVGCAGLLALDRRRLRGR